MKRRYSSINGERKATRKGEVGDEETRGWRRGRVSGERRRARELSKSTNNTFGEEAEENSYLCARTTLLTKKKELNACLLLYKQLYL